MAKVLSYISELLNAVNLLLKEKHNDYSELQEVIWTDSTWIYRGSWRFFLTWSFLAIEPKLTYHRYSMSL